MGDIEREYQSWIELYDRVDTTSRREIMAQIARMPHPPLISVLMPVFNPVPDHLLAAIRSVRDQLYPFWELCIGDDASTDPAVVEVLGDAAADDPRIKVMRRARNGHISAASNSALRLANGAFVALLDHDDILPPHALYEVAARVADQPEVDIIYSDEDHIDDTGRRSHPYFKPDWNPELMLGQNLISHLGVYRRELLERVGGFRTGFEGSQDHDLALRVVAETSADRIMHIPKVLYHWRQGATDQTFSEASHERCVRNGRRAVQAFVARDQPEANAEPAPLAPGWTRIVYPVSEPAPLVSVILPYHGSATALSACLRGLLKQTDYPALDILILAGDAANAVQSNAMASDHRVHVLSLQPTMLNQAAEAARGSLLLMFDTDLQPADPGWLPEMVSRVLRADTGAVGPKLLSRNGLVRHAGLVVGGPTAAFTPFLDRPREQTGYFGHLQLARDVTAVSGQCILVKRRAFEVIGGLDEALLLTEYGDVDLCLKLAEAGYRILWTPFAELFLRDEIPRPRTNSIRFSSLGKRMHERWGDKLDTDRYWSPNLSCAESELGLAFPPRIAKARPSGRWATATSDVEAVQ